MTRTAILRLAYLFSPGPGERDGPSNDEPASIPARLQGVRPGNHIYCDRIRRGDEQEEERLCEAEGAEGDGRARGGPPKEDPPPGPVFRMVSRRCHEADHEHR